MIETLTQLRFSIQYLLVIVLTFLSNKGFAAIPRPDHVVICMLENHEYHDIIGSSNAPYINSLLPQSASLEEYYGLTHPSQPNYIMLFSGSNQGETGDNVPSGTPWSTPNLGSMLEDAGFTFGGFSEDLPVVGSTVGASGAYARKHSPWVNWQGNGPNQISPGANMSMQEFPADFDHLPTVSFVIPNQANDMHNGTDPGRIITGDNWIQQYLKPYIDWTYANNSLFILTFDEDDRSHSNHIVCLFIGPMVKTGSYSQIGYDHYDMLRTLEEMYGLPYAGNSNNAKLIDEVWISTVGVDEIPGENTVGVYPNPFSEYSQISFTSEAPVNSAAKLIVYDAIGRIRSEEMIETHRGKNSIPFRRENLSSGLYTFQISDERNLIGKGKFMIN